MHVSRLRRALVAAMSISCAQCASASSSSLKVANTQQLEGSGAADLSSMELLVNSTRETNQGNVLHMMVRSVDVDKAVTTTESYEDATSMLFAPERDPDVVAAQPIFPGHPTRLQLKEPEGNSVVLYFFFTNPGESWRVQVSSPPPDELTIELGANEVASVSVER
jgi:hypothetical protein